MLRDEAMAQTIRDCEEQGIMVDFVREHLSGGCEYDIYAV